MLTDLLLAIAHHILMFSLLGILVVEMTIVRPGMSNAVVFRLARIDVVYGVVAGLILIVGFCRVFFGDKGPGFYLSNWVFWAKITAFVVLGLLSIRPTMRIIAWRNAAKANPGFSPEAADAARVRQMMHYQGFVFVLIPIFAALMARGYGL